VPDGQSEAGVPTTDEMLAPSAVEEILTFELAESAAGAPPAHAAPAHPAPAHAARAQASPGADRAVSPRSTPGELHVQELAKLRPGGRTRRLRLLPELPGQSGHPASPSRSVGLAHAGRTSRELVEHALTAPLRELAAWLAAHEALEDSASLYFSLAVPATVLEIDDLPEILAECVRATRLATGSIGFEIPESACVREPERVERLIHTLEQLGCFLVLDDFTFDTGALELLRSKALRLVKVDRTLIRAALRDKLAQARIVAISQAARVLGIHCAAKHVDGLATQRWLAAAG
jgi:EAL domain-containing protein (putative c-di-GMP-specific phosphodiesterase class I)